ncbi:hypothetical protein [Pseudomonas sp. PSE14]|uniref:hypothetical protein n=1 Tax=Pseudomonas sp. PSE14 TaxID=3016341 RepID=UPI0023D7CA24|nr:hypothetical protein [Pseudomonas sp. PSE14]WEJ70443.1 hypothetical protein O6P39_17400 [Pseudomonas sp. PSE14]
MILLATSFQVDRVPTTCPWCQHAIHPEFKSYVLLKNGLGKTANVFFQCVAADCLKGFIGEYYQNTNYYCLTQVFPQLPVRPHVDEEVAEISNGFVQIYQQAGIADSTGLDQICGVGYRKALEFLIKDYCCHKQPDREEEIKNATLSQVINNYVDNGNIKACAVRAVWLGNDETHYVRKWEDKDINDLKMLINLTCAWIKTEALTEKYMKEMEKS